MANKIQIRRGLKTNLPTLDVGEPAICTDTKEVFVGNAGGNVALINKEMLDTHIGDYTLQVPYSVASGAANSYSVTLNPAMTSYSEGVAVAVKINENNTGASTININNLGAKSIRDPKGNVLTTGKLVANSIYTLRYNGVNFILQGEGAYGNATESDLLFGKKESIDAGEKICSYIPKPNLSICRYSQKVISGTSSGFSVSYPYHLGILELNGFVAWSSTSGDNGKIGTLPANVTVSVNTTGNFTVTNYTGNSLTFKFIEFGVN